MAIFAIGDVQGCYDDLRRLLDRIRFNPAEDRLWLTGDLVNRGPKSLEVLRFVSGLGDRALAVLGNHDLHLLALAYAGSVRMRSQDTLQEVLEAQDCEELLHWLRHQPLLHHDATLGYTLVHAGLPPQWDLPLASHCAREAEACLQGEDFAGFLADMYGDMPAQWSDDLAGTERLRFIVNSLTRIRYCDSKGRLNLKAKGAPGTQAPGDMPWFEIPGRKSENMHILFGHWSTLGRHTGHNVYPLDSGCVWGGQLTAMRLDEDGGWYSIDCDGAQSPT